MNVAEGEKLLSGYATGTLTPAERESLLAASLHSQVLFDALADEEQPILGHVTAHRFEESRLQIRRVAVLPIGLLVAALHESPVSVAGLVAWHCARQWTAKSHPATAARSVNVTSAINSGVNRMRLSLEPCATIQTASVWIKGIRFSPEEKRRLSNKPLP